MELDERIHAHAVAFVRTIDLDDLAEQLGACREIFHGNRIGAGLAREFFDFAYERGLNVQEAAAEAARQEWKNRAALMRESFAGTAERINGMGRRG